MSALKSLSNFNLLNLHTPDDRQHHEAEEKKKLNETIIIMKKKKLQFVARGRLKVNCCLISNNVQFCSKKSFYRC